MHRDLVNLVISDFGLKWISMWIIYVKKFQVQVSPDFRRNCSVILYFLLCIFQEVITERVQFWSLNVSAASASPTSSLIFRNNENESLQLQSESEPRIKRKKYYPASHPITGTDEEKATEFFQDLYRVAHKILKV